MPLDTRTGREVDSKRRKNKLIVVVERVRHKNLGDNENDNGDGDGDDSGDDSDVVVEKTQ